MFKTGLLHGGIVLLVVALATLLSTLFKNNEVVAITINTSTIISWLIVGYFYKKKYGSFFTFLPAQKKSGNVYGYIIGIGVIWGPAKLFIAGYPIDNVPIIINILLGLIAIPFSGVAVIGAIIVGGWFYKGKEKPLTSGSS